MNDELKMYFENNTKKPWGKMFYKLIWEQLPELNGSKILDFGSGIGITANHLAENNEVIAIEPNIEMAEIRIKENDYEQLIGSVEQLKMLKDNSFDAVICHNVFEYAKERKDIFREFYRVLKPNGMMSIIKHNHTGRIAAKVIFENNLDEAIRLLHDGESKAAYFGKINYYTIDDIKEWAVDLDINVESVRGIRTFFALHPNNEIRHDPEWQEKMFEIEMKVSNISDYVNMAFFNHVLLKKIR